MCVLNSQSHNWNVLNNLKIIYIQFYNQIMKTDAGIHVRTVVYNKIKMYLSIAEREKKP